MDLIIQILTCVLGTIGFAVTMKAPKKALVYIALGSLISAGIERTMSLFFNYFISCLTAMIILSMYCEIIARIIKTPTTVTLMPSTIPLLPGSSIYYTMFWAINGNKELMNSYASSTLLSGLGIALGAAIASAIVKFIYLFSKKQDNNQ